jgi:hypothetical protein
MRSRLPLVHLSFMALPFVCSLSAGVCAEPGVGNSGVADPGSAVRRTAEPASTEYSRARALYRRASRSFEAGHYSDARRLLLEAWALRQSYDVAASLGDTEVKLGMFADAADHLSFSLRNFPPLENEQALANVHRQLDVARQQVAAVHVTVEAGASISVDQRPVGTSPLEDAVFLTPGRHVIEAHKGTAVATREGIFQATKESSVSLELGPTSPAAPEDAHGARSVVPLIVGGAVVAAGLTAGIAFRLSADADDDHANGIRARLGQGACAGSAGSSADCATLRDDVDGANRAQALSTTGFVVAGIAAVATPIWWLLTPRAKHASSVGMSALVRPGLATLTASGRF